MMLGLLGFMACVGVFIYARRTSNLTLARNVSVVAALGGVAYFSLLLSTSLTSSEQVLGLHERKAFCGAYLDCHLGVSVEAVQQVKVIGQGTYRMQAEGVFHLITIKVSSDAQSMNLRLSHPRAILIDNEGHRYERSEAAEHVLEHQAGTTNSLLQPVKPGGSFSKTLIFDVPDDIDTPRLLISKGSFIERLTELFLIGDEDSLFHKKTLFTV